MPAEHLRLVRDTSLTPPKADYTGATMIGDGDGGEPPMTNYVTHAEFQEAVQGLKSDVADVRADIHKGIVETQRWMFATVIGLFVGFGGLFMAMSNALKPSAPATTTAQPAPIIIQLPAAPAAPPPSK